MEVWTQSLHEEFSIQIQGTQLDVQVVKVSINKWTQILCEELAMEIQGTWYNIQGRTLVKATWRMFRTWLVEAEAQVGHECIRNTASRADKIKPTRFDGYMSLIFSLPIKAIVGA
jgi:hypothetical protein